MQKFWNMGPYFKKNPKNGYFSAKMTLENGYESHPNLRLALEHFDLYLGTTVHPVLVFKLKLKMSGFT